MPGLPKLVSIALVALLAAPAGAQTLPAPVVGAWEAALQDMRAGRPRAAIPVLEVLVRDYPGVTAFRLELALAHFQAQDAANAAFHFNRALEGELTDAQRRQVERHLRAIEERRDWSTTLSFNIVPESNPGRSSRAETINIGGFDFVIDPPAPSGVGIRLGAGVTYTPRFSRDVSGLLSLSLSSAIYENGDMNDIGLRGEAGLTVRGDPGRQVTSGLYANRRWLGGDGFSREHGVFAGFGTRPVPGTSLSLRGEYGRLSHDTLANRDGSVLRLSGSVSRTVSPQLAVRARLSATRTSAVADFNSGKVLGAGVGMTYRFESGWMASGDLNALRERRDGRSPLFVQTRADTEYSATLRASNGNFSYRGFTPVLELGFQRRDSNIALYEFKNTWMGVGFSRTF